MTKRLLWWAPVMWLALYCNPLLFWLQDLHRQLQTGGFVS